MTKVLVVTGSVRVGRVADKILAQVQDELKNYPSLEVEVADLKELNLPFLDSELNPADENYKITHENVKKFSEMVDNAETVLILSPEYNHSFPGVLKNAIDWLYREWKDKKIAFIGYGWVGGARSIKHLRQVFGNLNTNVIETEANLAFTKEIDLKGNFISDDAKKTVNKVLGEL